MPHVFHAGQRVKCIHRHGAEGQFTPGNIYEVRSWTPGSISVIADDRGERNGWLDSYFEPVADNRQSITLYTVVAKNNRGQILSRGYTTEQDAEQYKQIITMPEYVRAGWEVLAMKKITVRI